MLMKDRFKELVPEVASIKRFAREGVTVFWKVFDAAENCIGYAFYVVVPETHDPSLEIEEFDKYEVLCILGFDYRVVALDICAHPEAPERLWAQGIVETPFKGQYINRGYEDLYMAPEGKIDAISDGTISSTLVTNAIREKVAEITEITKE